MRFGKRNQPIQTLTPNRTDDSFADRISHLSSLTNQGGAAGLYFSTPLSNGIIPGAVSCTVKHFTTFDLYGKWDVTDHLNLHGSVTNLFDTKAPLDWATYGGALGAVPWNPSLHLQGAIGAFFNVGVTYKF